MSPDYQTIGIAIGSAVAGAGIVWKLAVAMLKREVTRVDSAIDRMDHLEAELQAIKLAMVRDIPTKDDHNQVLARLDKLDAVLTEMRDMVIRQDERGKIHDKG